jgi:uncharacterized protein
MQLHHRFTVSLPIDDAWRTLTDLEGIAPCLPGARVTGRDGDDYLGIVRVKVGPITTEFSGAARFTQLDSNGHLATIAAEGRDAKTSGVANAVVRARLMSAGDNSTEVAVETDLAITGRLAQFGRGAISDISAKLLDQFANNLDQHLSARSYPSAEASPQVRLSHVQLDPAAPSAPLDIAGLVSRSLKRKLIALLASTIMFSLLVRRRRRRNR